MAPLLDIPPELFYQIFGLLYSSDLLSLRQTSKAVNELITPIATAGRKLIIDLGTKSSFESDFKTIREVSTTGTISTLLPHIRSLLIESLHAPRSRVRRLDKPGPDEPATRALLDQHFAPFIRNLQALDTVQLASPSTAPLLSAGCTYLANTPQMENQIGKRPRKLLCPCCKCHSLAP